MHLFYCMLQHVCKPQQDNSLPRLMSEISCVNIVLGNPGSLLKIEPLFCHPVKHETECHKATCQWPVKQSSRLTKNWPGASVPLFASNTLMRAVKLSNALHLPSGTNNSTFNLAVLDDINKHSCKDTLMLRNALACSQTNQKDSRVQIQPYTHTHLQDDRERGRQREICYFWRCS